MLEFLRETFSRMSLCQNLYRVRRELPDAIVTVSRLGLLFVEYSRIDLFLTAIFTRCNCLDEFYKIFKYSNFNPVELNLQEQPREKRVYFETQCTVERRAAFSFLN